MRIEHGGFWVSPDQITYMHFIQRIYLKVTTQFHEFTRKQRGRSITHKLQRLILTRFRQNLGNH